MRKWLVFFCIFFIILSLVAYLSLNNSEAINNENEAEIYVYDKKDDEEDKEYFYWKDSGKETTFRIIDRVTMPGKLGMPYDEGGED